MPQFSPSEWALIAAATFVFGWLLGRGSASSRDEGKEGRQALERQSAEAAFASLPAETQQEADRLIGARKYIEAIKLVRDHSSLDLRSAKLAIDERRRRLGA